MTNIQKIKINVSKLNKLNLNNYLYNQSSILHSTYLFTDVVEWLKLGATHNLLKIINKELIHEQIIVYRYLFNLLCFIK